MLKVIRPAAPSGTRPTPYVVLLRVVAESEVSAPDVPEVPKVHSFSDARPFPGAMVAVPHQAVSPETPRWMERSVLSQSRQGVTINTAPSQTDAIRITFVIGRGRYPTFEAIPDALDRVMCRGVHNRIQRRLRDLRCAEHRQPPRVIASGPLFVHAISSYFRKPNSTRAAPTNWTKDMDTPSYRRCPKMTDRTAGDLAPFRSVRKHRRRSVFLPLARLIAEERVQGAKPPSSVSAGSGPRRRLRGSGARRRDRGGRARP
jgi:hypothetical protein